MPVKATLFGIASTEVRSGEDGRMRFESLYAHGFARVAACTADVYIADPLRNAESVVEVSRRAVGRGRRGRGASRSSP